MHGVFIHRYANYKVHCMDDAGNASPTDASPRTGCSQETKTMHSRTLSLSALLVASTLSFNAFAQDVVPTFAYDTLGAAKTRSAVQAEQAQARTAGKSYIWGANNLPQPSASVIPRTRAEVLAELRDAQATGEYAALHSEEPARVVVKRSATVAPALAGQIKPEAH
jgi:hypothetical protein